MWWCSWLRHCTTSRKVAGLIPDDVVGFFHWHNPSGRTMFLGSTQPLTEMSTRNVCWWVKLCRADNLTIFMCRLSWNLAASTFWNPQGLSRPVMGLLYLHLFAHDEVSVILEFDGSITTQNYLYLIHTSAKTLNLACLLRFIRYINNAWKVKAWVINLSCVFPRIVG
jgi:hypothetical protein